MGVIREKYQFRNQKIGVTRVDTGEGELWNTVANAADQLTQQAFQMAEIEAKKTGKEVAENMSEKRLRTIDPATGKPIAYQAPASFGIVAQAAFEETIDRRYIRSVEQEIRDKANETYLRYVNDPQGPEKYTVDMEDYVGQMTKNANSRFQNMVRDTGAAYIASTKLNLLTKRQNRIVEQEQGALTSDNYFSIETIQAIGKGVGADLSDPNSVPMQNIQAIINEQTNALNAAVDAGIFTDEQRRSRIRSLQLALPEGILQNTLNADVTYEIEPAEEGGEPVTVSMTEDVAQLVESSLSSGKVIDALPTSLKPLVQTILDSSAYNTDADELIRKASELRVDLANQEGTKRKATALELRVAEVSDPSRRVDASEALTQEAADQVVANNTSGLNENPNPDMISYYMSPDSLNNQTLNELISFKGILPESFMTAFDHAFNLRPMSNDELTVVLTHYDRLSQAQITSKNINVLTANGGLTKEQDAFFRSLSALSKVKGSTGRDSTNLVGLAASLRENYQNPELVDNNLRREFGDFNKDAKKGSTVLTSYLSSKFGDDYTMHQLAEPLVKYMVSSGMSFSDIDKQVTNLFETTYIETDGLVIDRHNKQNDRSMFAIARVLPDPKEQNIFVREVQLMLNERFGEGEYTFTKSPKDSRSLSLMGIEANKVVKLVPITTNAATPDIIEVETMVEGKDEPVMQQVKTFTYMAVIEDDNGELVFLSDEEGPVMVTTDIAKQAIATERALQQGKEIKASEIKVERKKSLSEVQSELPSDEEIFQGRFN
mgnify:CR=1 FL=1